MKKLILIVFSLCFTALVGIAQTNSSVLFNEFLNKDYTMFDAKAIGIINKAVQPYADEFALVQIDPEALQKKTKTIQLSPSIDIKLTLDSYEEIDGRIKIRYKTRGDGALLLSVLGDDVMGYLYSASAVYSIKSLGNGFQIMHKVESKFYPGSCGYIAPETVRLPQVLLKTEPSGEKNIECKLRVLVMYTPAAIPFVANIRNTAALAVDITNESLTNSQINHQFELAYVGKVDYTEVGVDEDMESFVNLTDGPMDIVGELRQEHAADVCVLLSDGTDYVVEIAPGITRPVNGVAQTIFANAENSFCVVHVATAIENLTFPHEIGHLLGARHDFTSDPTTTPFAQGHGFVNQTQNYRTIMGIGGPDNERIPFWSHPNNFYNGFPTGIQGISDNASVLNATIIDTRTFVSPNPVVIVSQDFPNGGDYRDVVSSNRIETNGDVHLHYQSIVTYRAAQKVELVPGFRANSGSSFIASIDPVDHCPGNPNAGNGVQGENSNDLDISNPVTKLNLFPNPNDGSFTVESDNMQLIEVYNSIGALVHTVETGDSKVNISGLSQGVYFVKVFETTDQYSTQRIVVF